jgi:hypothetical protein
MSSFQAHSEIGRVEELEERIFRLQVERQRLRASDAQRADIEHNRLEIVRSHWELSHALIERYLPESQLPAAA